MASEKKWLAVIATPLTADGTNLGLVTVADTTGFKVKGSAYLATTGPTQTTLQVQIQRVLSPTQMIVGTLGSTPAPNNFVDVSMFTLANGAIIAFPEQDKNKIKPDDIEQAVYEADPTVAIRTVFVDQYGRFYNASNPLPISFDGTIVIGKVEVSGQNGNTIEPNPNGSINVVIEPSTGGAINVRNKFGTLLVPVGLATVINTYTCPMNVQGLLQRVQGSGENRGVFTVAINGVTQSVLRNWYTDYNVNCDFTTGQDNGLTLQPGDVVTVTILQNSPNGSANFDARIQVVEIAT